MSTVEADKSFTFDTDGATQSDLVIYYGPAGKDACAEMGAAWASKVPIIGLHAKGEDLGLMRKMVSCWCDDIDQLLDAVLSVDYQKQYERQQVFQDNNAPELDDLPF